jgi:hypothetical protein
MGNALGNPTINWDPKELPYTMSNYLGIKSLGNSDLGLGRERKTFVTGVQEKN